MMRRRFSLNKRKLNNVILYTSIDNNVITPIYDRFGTPLVSNTYKDVGKMVFTNNIFYIGREAFYNCANLTSIQIPNSVTSIGRDAFNKCSKLESVVFGDNIKDIAYGAFGECTNLTNIKIPNITHISSGMFIACWGLSSINIPDSVVSIGDSSFLDCRNLISIEIPNNITSIGDDAFRNCLRLSSVYIKATTPPILGNIAFTYNAENRKIYVPRASLDAYKTASGWKDYASAIVPYDY